MTFGSRLKKLRQNYNMTQQDLATAIRLSKANVSKYESDQIQPSMETLVMISELFHVSVDYLLGAPTDFITKQVDLSEAESKLLALQGKKPADEGELREDVVIYHRDGKTVKRTFTKEQLALFHAMLDAIPEDPGDNKGL